MRTLCITLLLTSPLGAQWSNDPALNLLVADGPSEQAQSKVVPTPDGGVWISWFDGQSTGWDVRLQRLNAHGVAQLGTHGILIADRSFSSTQDYGLSVDSTGAAALAFRDDRSGTTQITAARVLANGTQVFGPAGIQLTATASFVAAPKIAGLAGGAVLVAWTQDSTVRLMRLDPAGVPLWPVDTVLSPANGSYSVSDLSTDGVLGIVHATGGFSSPRHLLAQRVDSAGGLTWGATPVAVFDGGSLQIGNFPALVGDGQGGAWFSWYDTSSLQFQVSAQRILAGGVEAFAHNGVVVSTNTTRVRVNPHLAFDAGLGAAVIAWIEQNSGQSQWGVSAQAIEATTGARLWGAEGRTILPLGSTALSQSRAVAHPGGALVAWDAAPAFGTDRLFGAALAATGALAAGPFDIASTPAAKARLAVTRSLSNQSILCWTDDRSGGGDLYAQAVRDDGTLGPPGLISSSYCHQAAANSTGSPGELSGTGSNLISQNNLQLTMTSVPSGQSGYFLASQAAGFVANPAGSQGNLCVTSLIARLVGTLGVIANSTHSASIDLTNIPLPPTQAYAVLAGETWYFQGWHRDFNPTPTSNFTSAFGVTFQ